jgi:uncharacterized membrane protein
MLTLARVAIGSTVLTSLAAAQQPGLYCPTTGNPQFCTDALSVSANGVVTGNLFNNLGQDPSYTWSLATGLVPRILPNPPAISGDGLTVVGQAIIWNESTGYFNIPNAGFYNLYATAVSYDGSIVVGRLEDPNGSNPTHMFRWTAATGTVDLGWGEAIAITPDGSVIVGTLTALHGPPPQPYRYTDATGTVPLNIPTGFLGAYARGVSADGTTVVGYLEGYNVNMPFRWTAATGTVSLGDIPGGSHQCNAFATNHNGSLIVGSGDTPDGTGHAFIWDTTHGMRLLRDVLVNEFHVDMTGWSIYSGLSMSPDGRYIVGLGRYEINSVLQGNGYVAIIEPCYANCDQSTTPPQLNVNDFVCFLNKFAAGDSYTNCDGSTRAPILNANDFQCFLNSFAAGCS